MRCRVFDAPAVRSCLPRRRRLPGGRTAARRGDCSTDLTPTRRNSPGSTRLIRRVAAPPKTGEMTITNALQRLIAAAIVVALGFPVASCSQEQEAPEELQTVTLGMEAAILPSAVWIAEEKGYFQQEGLAVTVKPFDSGRLSFEAMLEGEGVDISTVTPVPIMFNSFDRRDFCITATFAYSFTDMKVIARRDHGITTTADLKGKRVGTPKGTTGQYFLEVFLMRNGIPTSDVELVDTGPSELPQALESGQVDAIVIWEPHADLARQLLGEAAIQLPSADIHRTSFNFMAMKEFAQTRPDVLTRFLRAIDKATAFIADHEAESQAIVADRLKLEKDAVTQFWPDFTFELSLDQSLIVTLEAEARWAVRNKLTTESQVPNYLDYVCSGPLQNTNPQAIRILR